MSKKNSKESNKSEDKVKKSKKADKHAKIPEDRKQRAAESAFSFLVADNKTVAGQSGCLQHHHLRWLPLASASHIIRFHDYLDER